GGICIVRVVHSLFASTDDWDNQLESAKSGWSGFLRILQIYLRHFRGQRSAIMQVTTPVASTEADAWETLTAALGVKGVSVGQRGFRNASRCRRSANEKAQNHGAHVTGRRDSALFR